MKITITIEFEDKTGTNKKKFVDMLTKRIKNYLEENPTDSEDNKS